MQTPRRIAVAVLAACVSIGSVQAADIVVRYSLQFVEVNGALASGTVNVTVSNQSGAAVRNVDLRLAQPGPTLLQLGTIPAGEARIAKGNILFDANFHRTGAPLSWKVEYDAAAGHREVIVQGLQVER